jgi:hypothetical protein
MINIRYWSCFLGLALYNVEKDGYCYSAKVALRSATNFTSRFFLLIIG